MSRRSPNPRTFTALVVLALAISSLAPARFTSWITWFRGPLMAVLAPVSGPATAVGTWLRPGREAGSPFGGLADAELTARIESLDRLYGRSLTRIAELEGVIRDIQSGVSYPASAPVRRLEAARVGANLAAGTIEVGRGKRHGVTVGGVAVARRSEQLVGIVTQAGSLTSTVHLLTDRHLAPGLMVGVVVPAAETITPRILASAPLIQMRPHGDGTLIADSVGVDLADRIEPGDRVRLLDETWPSAASMLVLGRVERIRETDDPLFRTVIVRPEVEPARLRSLILQTPLAESPEGVGP